MTQNTNKFQKISKYFTLGEATYQPRLMEYYEPTPEELETIKQFAQKMDVVREFLGKPIHVHCWIRSKEYNKLVGGATASMHLLGRACDFHVQDMTTDEVKALLIPKLAEFGLRMEDNGQNSKWIHLDNKNPGPGKRFFKP